MPPVIRLLDNVTPVEGLDEHGIAVPQLMCDDLKGVSGLEAQDGVGVTPVVERGAREFQYRRGIQMLCEGRELTDPEEIRVVRKLLGIVREDPPRPGFGSTDDSVPPAGFPAPRVDGSLPQIDVSPRESLHNLPFNARSGHESLNCAVGHGESVDECFSLYAVKPDVTRGVGSVTVSVAYNVVGDDALAPQPPSELRQGHAIPVLRGARAVESIQKLSDVRCRERGGRKNGALGNEHPHLSLVLGGLSGPLSDEGRQIMRGERGRELIQAFGLESVVYLPEVRFLLDDEAKGGPVSVMRERFHHALDVISDILARRPAGVNASTAIRQRDPSLEPFGALRTVRHGRNNGIPASPLATCSLETTLTPCA